MSIFIIAHHSDKKTIQEKEFAADKCYFPIANVLVSTIKRRAGKICLFEYLMKKSVFYSREY